jgi:hypothetical protein
VLREVGSIGDDTYNRTNAVYSGLLDTLDTARLASSLHTLQEGQLEQEEDTSSAAHRGAGLTTRELQLVLLRHPQTFSYSQAHLIEVLDFLTGAPLELSGPELRAVVRTTCCNKHTRVLSHIQCRTLRDPDILCLDRQDTIYSVYVIDGCACSIRAQVTRFPQVFSFSVKAHLRPQLAYLSSLGVDPQQLRDYVVARPSLLGEVR